MQAFDTAVLNGKIRIETSSSIPNLKKRISLRKAMRGAFIGQIGW